MFFRKQKVKLKKKKKQVGKYAGPSYFRRHRERGSGHFLKECYKSGIRQNDGPTTRKFAQLDEVRPMKIKEWEPQGLLRWRPT